MKDYSDENDKNYIAYLYEKYEKKLYYIANSYLKNHFDSEDCVQDVFVVVMNKLDQFRSFSIDHQKNFMIKVCRCIAINKYNENTKRNIAEMSLNDSIIESEFEIVDNESYLDKILINDENYKIIYNIIDNMDSKYGDILYLKLFLNMKNNEIAKLLNLPLNLINVRLNRAKIKLKETMSKNEVQKNQMILK